MKIASVTLLLACVVGCGGLSLPVGNPPQPAPQPQYAPPRQQIVIGADGRPYTIIVPVVPAPAAIPPAIPVVPAPVPVGPKLPDDADFGPAA